MQPASVFGVPDEKRIARPNRGALYRPDQRHKQTLVRIGYGDLPIYRDPKDAIRQSISSDMCLLTVTDNYLTVEYEADMTEPLPPAILEQVQRLTQHLSVDIGCLAHAKHILTERGTSVDMPQQFMQKWILYDLDQVRRVIRDVGPYCRLTDPVLAKALLYHEHGLLLLQAIEDVPRGLERQRLFLQISAFMSFWKAISLVAGDPQQRDHQRRCKAIKGLPKRFYDNHIRKMHELRNHFDVAHSSLDEMRLQLAAQQVGSAKTIAETLIKAYRSHLAGGNPGLPPPP
jgi:hypothetical protein